MAENKHWRTGDGDVIEVTPNHTIVSSKKNRDLIGGIIRMDRGVVTLIGGHETAINLIEELN